MSENDNALLINLAKKMDQDLKENILPFWYQTMDLHRGGFVGKVDNYGKVDLKSSKGLVMHSRYLWGYSQAWLYRHSVLDLKAAAQAFQFLTTKLYDSEGKGFWWVVDSSGKPTFENKVLYGQAFAIYGLSQYFLATGDKKALALALETFELLEKTGRDREFGGYYEAVDRYWTNSIVQALSDVDIPCSKSMNTNLHTLEALAALYRACGRPDVREALESLLKVFVQHILVTPVNLGLYFDRNWKCLTDHVSYGHDIEASWLMTESAEILYGSKIPEDLKTVFLSIAHRIKTVVLENGGSLPNELHQGHLDTNRIWWVQAECVVGLVNAWQLSHDQSYLTTAHKVWDWIERYQIDHLNGEWFWGVSAQGKALEQWEKGGLWKTCYHNGRACMEVNQRNIKGVENE